MDYDAPPPDDAELPGILMGLSTRAGSPDVNVRREAVEQLYELAFKVKAKAAAAVPSLIRGLKDPDPKIGEHASWALRYCAPDSLRPLVECLSHPAAFVRERAAQSLGNVGEEACDAAALKLRELLVDPDQAARERAAWALGLVRDTSDDAIRLLVRMSTTGTPRDAGSALHALGNIGNAAGSESLAPYREQVLGALKNEDERLRRWALYAAKSVGLDEQSWAEVLMGVVQHDDSVEVRSAALSDLEAIASSVDLEAALPILVERLEGSGREAGIACDVLGKMRPRPIAAAPFLRKALGEDELVLAAASALWRIEGKADAIVPAMRRVFDDYGSEVCDLICELGPAAQPLLPDVIRVLGEEDWDSQWAAADALRAMASSDSMALTALLEALAHPSPVVTSAAARALVATGPAAVLPLRALLADPADPRASWAAYALGEMGPVASESLPELRAALRSGSEPLGCCCAIAVARIAADATVVPSLVTLLRSDDPAVPRHAVAGALAELGPAAATAVETLEFLVDDDDFDVAEAAMQALQTIQGPSH